MRRRLLTAFAVLGAFGCAPGSLPGTPSPITVSNGGGRYDGTHTYRRVAGAFVVSEAAHAMTLALDLVGGDQISGQFTAADGSQGTLQGTVSGALNSGTFQATLLLTTPAGGALRCDGRGNVTGTLSGRSLTWTIGSITYANCPGLETSSQAQATAASPFPQGDPGRARVVVTIFPGTTIQAGRCEGGTQGYPFVVGLSETSGVSVTLDDTVQIEQRRGTQVVTSRQDNLFKRLAGGETRRYSVCETSALTYQAFFTGTDSSGNSVRFGSPLITFAR